MSTVEEEIIMNLPKGIPYKVNLDTKDHRLTEIFGELSRLKHNGCMRIFADKEKKSLFSELLFEDGKIVASVLKKPKSETHITRDQGLELLEEIYPDLDGIMDIYLLRSSQVKEGLRLNAKYAVIEYAPEIPKVEPIAIEEKYLPMRKIIKFFTYFFVTLGIVMLIFSTFGFPTVDIGLTLIVTGFLYTLALGWIKELVLVDKFISFVVILLAILGAFYVMTPLLAFLDVTIRYGFQNGVIFLGCSFLFMVSYKVLERAKT